MALWKKLLIVLVIVALVILGLYWAFRARGSETAQPLTAKVERGQIQRLLSVSGSVNLLDQINVTPRVAGKVAEIFVEVGDEVEAGQELLRIEVPDLDNQIGQAQINLDVACLRLEQMKEGASEQELTTLKLSVEKAQQELKRAEENLARAQESVTLTASIAENAVKNAEKRLEEAQANLELVKKSVAQSIKMAQTAVDQAEDDVNDAPNATAKEMAEKNLTLAQEKLEAQKIAGDQQIAAAESQVSAAEDALEQARQGLEQKKLTNKDLLAQAEAGLEAARMGLRIAQAQYDQRVAAPSSTAIQLQEKAIEQAELSLTSLLRQKEDSLVRSPSKGTIGSLNVKIGDAVMTNAPLVSLVNVNVLEVQASVPEVNVSLLKPDTMATVKADAYPGLSFTANFAFLNPLPVVTQGVVNYTAHFNLNEDAVLYLRPGMTVEVEVVAEEASNALLIPRSALHQEGSENYVQVWDGKKTEVRRVKVGILSDIQVEIKEGLQEGEEVVIPTSGSSFSLSHNFESPNPGP